MFKNRIDKYLVKAGYTYNKGKLPYRVHGVSDITRRCSSSVLPWYAKFSHLM